jgi:pSer/pThr/pTyr-binding forkhead associated (FHA) protein
MQSSLYEHIFRRKTYYIQDLKSSNGVFVNRVKIESPTPLRHGDFIELGTEVRLFFIIEEETAVSGGISKADSNNEISSSNNNRDSNQNGSFRNSSIVNRPQSTGSRRWSYRSSGSMKKPLEDYASHRPSRLSVFRRSRIEKSLRGMVIVLPSTEADKEKVKIHAEMVNWGKKDDQDFSPANEIKNLDVLTSDYEKLRLAYELSKYSISEDLDSLLQKLLELIFSVLPSIERGIVLLVDKGKSSLVVNALKTRDSFNTDKIIVSMTILNLVIHRKTCLITSDSLQDPNHLPESPAKLRSVISVPLISHDKVRRVKYCF